MRDSHVLHKMSESATERLAAPVQQIFAHAPERMPTQVSTNTPFVVGCRAAIHWPSRALSVGLRERLFPGSLDSNARCADSAGEATLVSTTSQYRFSLKFRVGRSLATEEPALTATLSGREVTIKSDSESKPLSQAPWLLIDSGGFESEAAAQEFGENVRRAVHVAGLCARVGVDAGDPGENRTLSQLNEEYFRDSGLLDRDLRIGPDVHGLVVLPDDGRTIFTRFRAQATVLANAADFVQALEEAHTERDATTAERLMIRRAVRVLNLAEMNTDPIAKVVLGVSTIEGMATDPGWSESQKLMIHDAAQWVERTYGREESAEQVVQAILRIRQSSIRHRIRSMLAEHDLLELWTEWESLYHGRSRLFHGGGGSGGEHRGDHLLESELHALGREAMNLCSKIVLSIAKREGLAIPGTASLHFGVV